MKVTKRILTLLSVIILLSVTVAAENNWQGHPTLCPTSYSGVNNPGYVCGVTSDDDPEFYDWDAEGVSTPDDRTTNRGSQIAGVNGGFVVDCYARSGSEPYCDNGEDFWCSPQQSCLDDQVKTLCTDFASESNSAQCTDECRNGFVQCAFDDNGEATPKSGNFDTREALTDDFSGQSNMCDTRVNQRAYPGEDSSGTEYNDNDNLASSNHEIVVDNSCQPACQSGYFNDDGDVSTGCEIEQGGFCQVEGVEGEWSCSGDPLNNADCFCQTNPVPFETDVNTTYSAETSLLWGYQLHPLGHLALLQSQKGGLFIVDNDGNIGISGDIYYNVTNVTNQTLNETSPSINFENLFEAGEDKVFETDEALVRGEQEGTGDLLELSSNEGTFTIYRNGTITFDDGTPGGPEPVIQSLADVLNQGNIANQDIDVDGNTLVNVGGITGNNIINTGNIVAGAVTAQELSGTPSCNSNHFLRWDGSNFVCEQESLGNGITYAGTDLDVEAGIGLAQTGTGLRLGDSLLGQACSSDERVVGITSSGQLDCQPRVVIGRCGGREQNYEESDTSWSFYSFCSLGTPSPSRPSFPQPGDSTSWLCLGNEGGSNDFCTASRQLDGSCGSAERNYDAGDTSYSGNFCSSGNPSPSNPDFPSQGGSESWTCQGENGGNSVTCTADRDSPAATPVDGVCGDLSTEGGSKSPYDYNESGWPTGNFCQEGDHSPTNIAFPSQGGSVSWTCQGQDGGTDASCSAYREEPLQCTGTTTCSSLSVSLCTDFSGCSIGQNTVIYSINVADNSAVDQLPAGNIDASTTTVFADSGFPAPRGETIESVMVQTSSEPSRTACQSAEFILDYEATPSQTDIERSLIRSCIDEGGSFTFYYEGTVEFCEGGTSTCPSDLDGTICNSVSGCNYS